MGQCQRRRGGGFYKKVDPLCGMFESLNLISERLTGSKIHHVVVCAQAAVNSLTSLQSMTKPDKIAHLRKPFLILKENGGFSENLFVHLPCRAD